MVPMICCKVGSLLLSDPSGPSSCSSSRQKTQTQLWMGSGFTGPHGGRQMFSPVDSNDSLWPSYLRLRIELSWLKNLSPAKTKGRLDGRLHSDA